MTDIAERLGHSVEMLLKVYAACIDGNGDRNNVLIAAALGGPLSATEIAQKAPTGDNLASEETGSRDAEGPVAA